LPVWASGNKDPLLAGWAYSLRLEFERAMLWPITRQVVVKVTFLGTGPSIPLPGRGNTAFMVESSTAPDSSILVECGPTVQLSAKNAGVDLNQVPLVFLSHRHGDHVLGFPTLLLDRMIAGATFRPPPLHVFCPASVVDVLEHVSLAVYPFEVLNPLRSLTWHPLAENKLTTIETESGVKLTAGPVGGPPTAPTLGLRLDFAEGVSLAYSADTAQCEEVPQLAHGCDLLIHEAYFSITVSGKVPEYYHSSARNAGSNAARAGCRMLALIHMGPLAYGHEDIWVQEAGDNFSGQIIAPVDGDIVHIDPPQITVVKNQEPSPVDRRGGRGRGDRAG
jgi:ribonuclease BN (tRNA processing enzyme)